jgi:hypothetical protein
MHRWNHVIIVLLTAGTGLALWLFVPVAISSATAIQPDMQTHISGYAILLEPKQSVNYDHYVGYFQVTIIDVQASSPEDELHAALTDSQGNMLLSKFFKGHLHEELRVPYYGPHAFVVTNPQDSAVMVNASIKSVPASQYPHVTDLHITLPPNITHNQT